MKESLKRKLDQMIKEEQKNVVDGELLEKLFDLVSGEPLYDQFTPTQRNTLNEFFREVGDYLIAEMMSGSYGSRVLLDAIIVLSFEVGYKFRGESSRPPL